MRRVSLGLCAAVLAVACRPRAPAEVPIVDSETPVAVAAAEPSPPPEPLPVAATPLELLPANTALVFWTPDATAAVDGLGRKDLVAAFAEELAMVGPMLGLPHTDDPLNPEQLAEFGIDPHRPLGVALVGLTPPQVVMFAAVDDERALLDTIERNTKETISIAATRGGRFASVKDFSLSIRDGWVLVSSRDGDDPGRLGMSLVDAHPDDSLAATDTFRRARDGMKPAAMELFVSVHSLVEEAVGVVMAPADLRWMEEEVERARSSGAPKAEIESLEEDLAHMREQIELEANSQLRTTDAIRQAMAGVHAVDVRLDYAPGWVEASGRALVEPTSLVGRLFERLGVGSASMNAADGKPLFAAEAAWNPAALRELVALAIRGSGESFASVSSEMERETGLSLDKMLDVFSGRAGFALTSVGSPKFDGSGDPAASLRSVGYMSVSSPAGARDLVDRVKPPEGTISRRGSGWQWKSKDGPDLLMTVVGDRLVAATDRTALSRFASENPGSTSAKLSPRAEAWWSDPRHAGRGLLSFDLIPLLSPSRAYPQEISDIVQRTDWRYDLDENASKQIPKSAEYKRQVKLLERSLKHVRKLEVQDAIVTSERNYALAQLSGAMHVVAEPTPEGYAFEGGWNFNGGSTVGAALVLAKAEVERLEDHNAKFSRGYQAAMDAFSADLAAVESARARDIETYLSRQGRSTQPKW